MCQHSHESDMTDNHPQSYFLFLPNIAMAAGGRRERALMLIEEPYGRPRYKNGELWITRARLAVLIVGLFGIVLVITGIALLALASSKSRTCELDEKTPVPGSPLVQYSGPCGYSPEAQRIDLAEFIEKVKATYYKHHPHNIVYDPDIFDWYSYVAIDVIEKVKAEYVAYDPTPTVIKARTDASYSLLKEFNNKDINLSALKPRERKAVAQIKHYLQHVFGQPYDVNYYSGDWLMGPNLFCWQPVCYHGYDVYNGVGLYHKPYNISDVKLIKAKLETHKAGILQYINNMKMGITKGMVRSIEECIAGADSIKRKYLNVSLYNETGKFIFKSLFS